MRKIGVIVFVLCLFGVAAVAQIPTSGNVYFGYSLNHGEVDPAASTETYSGWEASVEVKMLPHIGLVGDVAQQFGDAFFFPGSFPIDVRTEQYLFGPRASFRVGPIRPFVHFTIGAAHVRERNFFAGEDSDTSFAYAIGGGVDYRLVGPVSARFQLESLNTNFFDDWQHNTRFSTGLAVHF